MRTARTATLAVMLALCALAQATPDATELTEALTKVRGLEKEVDSALAEKKTIVEAAIFKAGPCEPGYYQVTPKDPCTVCGEDAYCAGGKLGKRVACPEGYSTAGVTTATTVDQCFITCGEGTYASVTTGPDAACYSCGQGFFCPGGAQNGPLEDRVSCELGFSTVVNDATGVEDCVIVCKPGQYAPNKYGPCQDCGNDAYCAGGPQDIPVKTDCPPATPLTNTTTGADPGACVACDAGTTFVGGDCLVECAAGFYLNATTDTACTACEIGFYCSGGIQTPNATRTACADGFTTVDTATAVSSLCVPACQPGYYSNGTLPCTACGSGFWCAGGPQPGNGIQEACPDNTFTVGTNSSTPGQCQTCAFGTPPTCSVSTCDPGYYAMTPSSPCVVCGVGYTCPGGPQTTPQRTVCPNGLTTLLPTSTAPAQCIRVCPAGSYAPTPTAACTACLSPYYCPGGSQADGPVRDPCPTSPPPGYVTLTDNAVSQADCVVTCVPGQYSVLSQGPCVDCGITYYCAGGPQLSPVQTACTSGLTTLTPTASVASECIAYECPPGLLPLTTTPPLNITNCGVVECDPCGKTNPDVYYTGKLGIYVQPSWSNSTVANTATLVCSFDKYDPLLCAQTSTSARDSCTTNDIAIDGAGNYYVLGRTGASKTSTSGWVIRVDANQTVGEPCKYEMLLQGIEPYAGLGAAPNSNLLYATGANSVLTLEIGTDGSLSTVGQLAVPGFTGAGDITAGPGNTVYAISADGGTAYQITVNTTTYIPTGVSSPIATTGSTYPAAFCTSDEVLGVSSFGPFGQVSDFTSSTSFVKEGTSGMTQSNGLSGAAVAPVCGTVPVPP